MLEVKIEISAQSLPDVEEALNEARRKILAGYTSGFDSNDEGSYTFQVAENHDAGTRDAPLEREEYNKLALGVMHSALASLGCKDLQPLPADPRGANCGGAYVEAGDQYPSVELAIDDEHGFEWRLSTNTDDGTTNIVHLGHQLNDAVKLAVQGRIANVFAIGGKDGAA